MGFYGVLMGIRYQSGQALESRLDRDQYDPDLTVTLKFPMALPYHIDDDHFERVDGKVEHNGEFYRLVKQKLEKDTLYIVCIKDHDERRLVEALSDYVKTYTDKPAHSKQLAKAFSMIKDFVSTGTAIQHASAGWDHELADTAPVSRYTNVTSRHASPPPRG